MHSEADLVLVGQQLCVHSLLLSLVTVPFCSSYLLSTHKTVGSLCHRSIWLCRVPCLTGEEGGLCQCCGTCLQEMGWWAAKCTGAAWPSPRQTEHLSLVTSTCRSGARHPAAQVLLSPGLLTAPRLCKLGRARPSLELCIAAVWLPVVGQAACRYLPWVTGPVSNLVL